MPSSDALSARIPSIATQTVTAAQQIKLTQFASDTGFERDVTSEMWASVPSERSPNSRLSGVCRAVTPFCMDIKPYNERSSCWPHRRFHHSSTMRRQDGAMLNLSPPRAITFLLSLVLIGLAVASLYLRVPTIGATVVKFRTWFFVGAYVVLALGVVSKSL
ncbi:hypothetical protein [Methylobacterium sp. WL12]|uniref:hypothetical protein n=1 Tax=Methylobacterium sp. WL12 TaxID=2603890 RepID=UPI001FEECE77|nr:hypothetical protein [Methylobacterium sp. WL12]